LKTSLTEILGNDSATTFAKFLAKPKSTDTYRKLYRDAVRDHAFKCAETLLETQPDAFPSNYLRKLRDTEADFLSGDLGSSSVARVRELLDSANFDELLKFCVSSEFVLADYETIESCFMIDIACTTPLDVFAQIFEHHKFSTARLHYTHFTDDDNFLHWAVFDDRADIVEYTLASSRAAEILRVSRIDPRLVEYSFQANNCLDYFIKKYPELVRSTVETTVKDIPQQILEHFPDIQALKPKPKKSKSR